MAKELSGSFVVVEISEDGINWKTIVCEEQSQLQLGTTLNETKTKCGTFSATSGNAPVITGSGVVVGDIAPASQATFMDLARYLKSLFLLYIRRQNSASGTITAGENTYIHGQGHVSDVQETSSVDDLSKFTFTLTFSGSYTLAIGS